MRTVHVKEHKAILPSMDISCTASQFTNCVHMPYLISLISAFLFFFTWTTPAFQGTAGGKAERVQPEERGSLRPCVSKGSSVVSYTLKGQLRGAQAWVMSRLSCAVAP